MKSGKCIPRDTLIVSVSAPSAARNMAGSHEIEVARPLDYARHLSHKKGWRPPKSAELEVAKRNQDSKKGAA
jgi:hypothetical protein